MSIEERAAEAVTRIDADIVARRGYGLKAFLDPSIAEQIIATAARIAIEELAATPAPERAGERPVAGEWEQAESGAWERHRDAAGEWNGMRAAPDGSWCVWNGPGKPIAQGDTGGRAAADAWARANPTLLDWRLPAAPRSATPAHRKETPMCECGGKENTLPSELVVDNE